MNRHTLPLLLLPAWLAAAPADTDRFQFVRDLPDPPDWPTMELAAAPVPADLYAQVRTDMADLRILDPAGVSVPFWITPRTEIARQTRLVTVPADRIGFQDQAAANRIELVYAFTNNHAAPDLLVIHTPLKNFEKAVSVYGRDRDGADWQPLVEQAVVFDASRFMDVARRDVELPRHTHRQLKIVLDEVTDVLASPVQEISRRLGREADAPVAHADRTEALARRDFRVDRIEFRRRDVLESVSQSRLANYPVTNLVVQTDARRKQTTVRFEAGRAPVTRLRVQTPAVNFSRACTLYAETGPRRYDQPRRPVARGTLRVFAFRSLNQTDLLLEFPELRAGAYELVIEDGDNPPLEIAGVTLQGPEYQVLFFLHAGKPCRLFHGAPDARRPDFDVTAIRAALDRGLPPRPLPGMGAARVNPDWSQGGAWQFNKKATLIGAGVVLALVLGAALYKAMRGFDAEGGDPVA